MPNPDAESAPTSDERLAVLLGEYQRLDAKQAPEQCMALLREAAPLVDRDAKPKKWAAIRYFFAQLAQKDHPREAINAYLDALSVFNETSERESWVECHGAAGSLLVSLHGPAAPQAEQAIVHLHHAVGDLPYYAEMLAELYAWRTLGDPEENWRNRIHYLELAAKQVSSDTEPQGFARRYNALGIAYAEQPGADFNRAIDKRIECHEKVLAAHATGEAKLRALTAAERHRHRCPTRRQTADFSGTPMIYGRAWYHKRKRKLCKRAHALNGQPELCLGASVALSLPLRTFPA